MKHSLLLDQGERNGETLDEVKLRCPYCHPGAHERQLLDRQTYGDSEAATGPDWTIYSFEITASAFTDALMRFSTLFGTPDLASRDVGREVLSVDAEFQGMKHHDANRSSYLNRMLSRPEARCRRFFEGNFSSLVAPFTAQGSTVLRPLRSDSYEYIPIWRDLRSRLLDWWSLNYLAHPPIVVLIGQGDVCASIGMRSFTHRSPQSH